MARTGEVEEQEAAFRLPWIPVVEPSSTAKQDLVDLKLLVAAAHRKYWRLSIG